jgi:hypothetical protein
MCVLLDEPGSCECAVDFETAVGTDPGCVEDEAEVVEEGAEGVDFEVDGGGEGKIVVDEKGAEEPGAYDVVVEVVGAGLAGEGLGGADAGGVSDGFEMGSWTYSGVSITVTPPRTRVGWWLMLRGRTCWKLRDGEVWNAIRIWTR